MISSDHIRNDKIRAEFNNLLLQNTKFAKFESELTKKRRLTYHDDRGNVYTADVEPHFALTSELQYWINVDRAKLPYWWDVCDILVAYWTYNIRTGKTYTAETASECAAYIQSLQNFERWRIDSVLGSFARHTSEIPYGTQLFNPAGMIGSIGGGKNNNALFAGVGCAAVIAIAKIRNKG